MEPVTPTPLEHSLWVSHLNHLTPPVKWYPPGTRVLRVEVEELEGEVVVSSSVTNQLSLTDGMTSMFILTAKDVALSSLCTQGLLFIQMAQIHGRQKVNWSCLVTHCVSPFVQIGIGVGACVGAVITCILFVVGMIIVKVLKIQRERRKGTYITSSSIYFCLSWKSRGWVKPLQKCGNGEEHGIWVT